MWSWPVCSGPANFATSYSAVTPQPGTSPMSRNSAFGAGFVIAGQTQEIFNDIGGVAVAYTNVLKVLAHSCMDKPPACGPTMKWRVGQEQISPWPPKEREAD